MRTNINLIQLFSDSNILREYAVYLKLKHLFKNGCIYNYNISLFAQKSNLSRNSIRRYIKFFIENKWCRMHKNNLTFISLPLLRSRYKVKNHSTLKISPAGNTQRILTNLRYQLIKVKDTQFKFLKGSYKDLHNPTGNNKLAKYKKALKLKSKGIITDKLIGATYLKISLKKLGTIINLSPSTAHNIIKAKVKERKAKIHKEPFYRITGTLHNLSNGMFNCKGSVYLPKCNKYEFN